MPFKNTALIVIICFCLSVKAQTKVTDSLNELKQREQSLSKALKLSDDDTNKIWAYKDYYYTLDDMVEKKECTDKVIKLSKKLNFYRGEVWASLSQSAILVTQGKYKEAIVINNSALSTAQKNNDTLLVAKSKIYEQSVYTHMGNFFKAIELSQEINKIHESLGVADKKPEPYFCIGYNYIQLKQPRKAIDFLKKATAISRTVNDSLSLSISLSLIGNAYSTLKEYHNAEASLRECLSFSEKLGFSEPAAEAHADLVDVYLAAGKNEEAFYHAQQAVSIANKINSDFERILAYESLSKYYLAIKDFKKAIETAEIARKISLAGDTRDELIDVYEVLFKAHYQSGNFKKAFDYLLLNKMLDDSLKGIQVQQNAQQLEAVYQSEKKQSKIIQLEKEKLIQQLTLNQKSTLIYGLVGGIAAITLIVFLYYKNTQRKQQLAQQINILQQQKIKELEQEKQLLAIDNIMKVQEAERARMAKDLHDGLGGILSGIKLNLSSMKGNVIIQEKDVNLFTKSIDQLDNAIAEMRRVAHNMMPEALLKFGLTEAIQDYCDGINESNTVKLKFTHLSLTTPLEKSVEVILYRIIQELTTNAIKHASAKNILIQLSKNDNMLTLTVEDDGKGFDTSPLTPLQRRGEKVGSGLQNVQSRVDYLKGTFDIKSSPSTGVSVNMEFPV